VEELLTCKPVFILKSDLDLVYTLEHPFWHYLESSLCREVFCEHHGFAELNFEHFVCLFVCKRRQLVKVGALVSLSGRRVSLIGLIQADKHDIGQWLRKAGGRFKLRLVALEPIELDLKVYRCHFPARLLSDHLKLEGIIGAVSVLGDQV